MLDPNTRDPMTPTRFLALTMVLLAALLVVSAFSGCSSATDLRIARTVHAMATTADLGVTVAMVSTGDFKEANPFVANVWPSVLCAGIVWGAAEWADAAGEQKTATIVHWSGAALRLGAMTVNLVQWQRDKKNAEAAGLKASAVPPVYVGLRARF